MLTPRTNDRAQIRCPRSGGRRFGGSPALTPVQSVFIYCAAGLVVAVASGCSASEEPASAGPVESGKSEAEVRRELLKLHDDVIGDEVRTVERSNEPHFDLAECTMRGWEPEPVSTGIHAIALTGQFRAKDVAKEYGRVTLKLRELNFSADDGRGLPADLILEPDEVRSSNMSSMDNQALIERDGRWIKWAFVSHCVRLDRPIRYNPTPLPADRQGTPTPKGTP